MPTDLASALRERISVLEDEQGELEDSLGRLVAKIEVLKELLAEEDGQEESAILVKKKPRSTKDARVRKQLSVKQEVRTSPDDEIVQEASKLAGTPSDIEERLSKRKFVPIARPKQVYGPGVHPGVGGPASRRGIGVKDNEPISGQ